MTVNLEASDQTNFFAVMVGPPSFTLTVRVCPPAVVLNGLAGNVPVVSDAPTTYGDVHDVTVGCEAHLQVTADAGTAGETLNAYDGFVFELAAPGVDVKVMVGGGGGIEETVK